MISVQEMEGVIIVRGSYDEMSAIYPKLKTWGFRYQGMDRSWRIKTTDLTPIKRKKFDELMASYLRPTAPVSPPAAPTVSPEVKDVADHILALKAELAVVGIRVAVTSTHDLIFEGHLTGLEEDLRKAGIPVRMGVGKVNLTQAEPTRLSTLLAVLEAYVPRMHQHLETIKRMFSPFKSWRGLDGTYRPSGQVVFRGPKSFDYKGDIQKAFAKPSFDGTSKFWFVWAQEETEAAFHKFFAAADSISEQLAAKESEALKAPAPKRENKRPAPCRRCGGMVAAGEGWLILDFNDEDEDRWVVEHKDPKICERVREEARLRAEIAHNKTKARKELRELAYATGTRPAGSHHLTGTSIFLDSNGIAYGGGSWVVVEPDKKHFWYVQNNGSDGDDWSHNNVQTGGAGAIGWRAPMTEQAEFLIAAGKE